VLALSADLPAGSARDWARHSGGGAVAARLRAGAPSGWRDGCQANRPAPQASDPALRGNWPDPGTAEQPAAVSLRS